MIFDQQSKTLDGCIMSYADYVFSNVVPEEGQPTGAVRAAVEISMGTQQTVVIRGTVGEEPVIDGYN